MLGIRQRRPSPAAPPRSRRAAEAPDQRAFEEAYDRYAPSAYSLALRLCGHAGWAEEIVCEAFLSLWRATSPVSWETEAFGPLLYALVHKNAVARMRTGERPSTGWGKTDSAHSDGSMPGRQPAPVEARRSRVHAAVSRLQPEQRGAIEVAYLSGHSYQQVADRLDIPAATAKARIRDGMAALRELLREPPSGPA